MIDIKWQSYELTVFWWLCLFYYHCSQGLYCWTAIYLCCFPERAMAHCGSEEVLIVGGVGCKLPSLLGMQLIYWYKIKKVLSYKRIKNHIRYIVTYKRYICIYTLTTLMAMWYKALPLTSPCLSPLHGFDYWPGHVRKLQVTWD